jgi:DNA-directed RNA polymerase specialized sigma24 family protein
VSSSEQEGARPNGSFHDSAERLLALIGGAAPHARDARDLEVVLDGLTRFLGGRFPALSAAEVADLASESLARFLDAVRTGNFEPGRPAAPYLTRIAHNLAVSHLRRARSGELPHVEAALDDEALAHLLDARATSERLQFALQAAAERGDHVLLRVVRAWLVLAEQRSEAPTSREVAERLAISHTTVNEALGRLREYLPD